MAASGDRGLAPALELRSWAVLILAVTLAAGCGSNNPTPTATGTPEASSASDAPSASLPADPSLPQSSTTPDAPPSEGATPSTSPVAVKTHWEVTGAMHLARDGTHALLLGDRRVLVVGDDRYSDGRYRSYLDVTDTSVLAELWDPATGTWERTDPLGKARAEFAAVALADGRALVAGGLNQDCQAYSSAYVFDPATERWAKTGLMGSARANAVAAVLDDGRVLVAGGYYSTSCWDYAYASTPGGPIALAAFNPGGSGLSAGGRRLNDIDVGPLGHALATAELFDPRSGTWSNTGPMRLARVGAQAVTLGDGRVLVWGGSDYADELARSRAEVFDPATGRFTMIASLPEIDRAAIERLGVSPPKGDPDAWIQGGQLVPLRNGDALLVGITQPWGRLEVVRSFRFRASRDAWSEFGDPFVRKLGPDWQTPVSTFGTSHPDGIVAAMSDGRVLFAGGAQPRAAELLAPGTGSWTKLPKLPAARGSGLAVALEDGSMLVVPTWEGYSEAFRLFRGQ
jgi:hypothetical protein